MGKHNQDLIGKKFTKLTVVSKGKPYRFGQTWNCLCDCGVFKKNIKQSNLKNNLNKSCGCIRRKRKEPGVSTINSLYATYRCTARDRNYSFDITISEFKDLIFKDCVYCKSPPCRIYKQTSKTANNDWLEQTKITYNGIDRINNNLGYIFNNCITCCYTCNLMKMEKSVNDFLNKIEIIYKNQDNIKRILCT